jgi:hypothetical protein
MVALLWLALLMGFVPEMIGHILGTAGGHAGVRRAGRRGHRAAQEPGCSQAPDDSRHHLTG